MDEPLKVLIADDEGPARARLRRLLEAEPSLRIVAEVTDGRQALQRAHEADVLFLDVEMPHADGFDVAVAQLGKPVVFITAHAHHAVQAFDVQAVDFLLKPASGARLAECVRRLHSREPTKPSTLSLVVMSRGALRSFDARAVTRFWATDKYVSFLDADGEEHLLRDSLEALQERLGDGFFRCHRGELVQLAAVTRLVDRQLELRDGQQVRVSRRSIAELRRVLTR